MEIKRLLKRAKSLGLAGLAGLVLLGFSGKAREVNAQEFVPQNTNLIQLGARNYSAEWSYGPVVDSISVYVQIGRGLTDKFTIYGEGSVENPVINCGYSKPGNPDNSFDVSPNHFIPSMALGVRGKFYETEDKKLSICGEARVSRVSEFDDSVKWSPNKATEIHLDGITGIEGSLWAKKDLGPLSLRGGVNFGSKYASGEVLTYTINSLNDVEIVYEEFNQRDKNSVKAIVGGNYAGKDWKFNGTVHIGKGTGVDIGFSKEW